MLANFFSLLSIAARREWHQRLLVLCLLAGLIVAVSILSSIPLYADAVQQRLMQGELTEAGTRRPPFSFLWRYIGTWNGNIDREKYQPLDEYLSQQGAAIFYVPYNPESDIHVLWLYDLENNSSRQLSESDQGFRIMNRQWSVNADGSRILFRNALDRNLWFMDIASQ